MDSAAPEDHKKHFLHRKLPRKAVIFLGLGLLVSVSVTLYILFFTGPKLKTQLNQLLKKEPTVALKTEVKNPFDKETQYVNPFDTYKSPFYTLKQTAQK